MTKFFFCAFEFLSWSSIWYWTLIWFTKKTFLEFICIYIYIYMHIHIHTHTHIYIYIYIYIYMHTHTHIYIYIYIYIYICIYMYIVECIFRQQVIIQASFVKEDGTLFVYYFWFYFFNSPCYFSNVGIYMVKELSHIFYPSYSTILLVIIRGSVVLSWLESFYCFNYL